MVENFSNELLLFPSYWEAEKIEHDSQINEVDIYINFNSKKYKELQVESYSGLHDYQDYRRWRHLDILQYKTFIKAKVLIRT